MNTIFEIIENLGVGGAQSMLFELAYAINKYHSSSYKQIIISLGHHRVDKEFIAAYNLPCTDDSDYDRNIKKIVASENPIVFYHKLAASDYSFLTEVKKHKIPVLAINHTLYNARRWQEVDHRHCDIMVSVSHNMDGLVQKWYPKIPKYTCIRNGVNQERFGDFVPSTNNKNLFITGRINRLCGWKHSEKWLSWISGLKLPLPMQHEYIGGRMNETSSKARVISSGNKIIMMGNISDFKQKLSIMKKWDVFLYETIKDEGISMSILESLACGIPVICSDNYGNKEIIEDGVNGFVFKDKNHAQEILYNLCKNKDQLEKLRKSTYEHFSKKLDAKYVSSEYITLASNLSKLYYGEKSGDKNVIENKRSNEILPSIIIENKPIPKDPNKFTIFSSCYNKGKYLNDWGNSILAQKYRPLEVVIINDASTDNSADIINSLKPKFIESGIEFFTNTNYERMYCGSSYRNMMQYGTGSYYGIVDSDDMLVPDAVEYIMGLYKKYEDLAWIYTQFEICDINMVKKRDGFCMIPGQGASLLSVGDKGVHGYGHWRTFNYKIPNAAKLFGKNLTCSVDKHMGYRLEEAGPGGFANRICYRYRQHPIGSIESVSSTKYAMEVWSKVKKDAHSRRKKNNAIIFPIRAIS